MRKNSIKNIRINEEVMRELSNIIRGEIKDPRINPMTSVVAVEVAPDLKTAKAYISVLGDKKSQADTLAGLKSAEGYIRRTLAKNINLRNTPAITFIIDQSIEYGVENMVYISCKPTSLARDLQIFMGRGYRVEKICCVDMFPNTYHVETVVKLSLKKDTPKIEVTMEPDEESNYTPE